MQNFTRKLLTEWRRLNLPFSNETFIIAVSGGADSCALAFAINNLFKRKKLQNRFVIAHFNHNLRDKESVREQEFVEDFARKIKFDFATKTAKVGDLDGNSNIEESARNARYNFIYETALENDAFAVLTAHHINDQAETFLLNLLRGSGLEGLSAMKTKRKLFDESEVLLVRPMLNWATREDVLQFVNFNDVEYKNDSMNDDLNLTRVKIRKELIPILKNYNPKIVENFAKTSGVLGVENSLIEELTSQNEPLLSFINSKILEVNKLQNLSTAMLYRVLKDWLFLKRGNLRNLEQKHYRAIVNLINSRKSGKYVELPNFETVKKENGKLIFQDVTFEK